MSSVPLWQRFSRGVCRGSARELNPGDHHYRAWVGPPENYDLLGALQFTLLVELGLREHHHLLDVGCGSLRVGRLLIPYLLPRRYHGLEPERWAVRAGIRHELGLSIRFVKRPVFRYSKDFRLSAFNRSFDYIIAQSIFTHAAAWQIKRCLNEASRALAPKGLFVATYLEGDEDHAGNEWVYPGVTRYTRQFMEDSAKAAGLSMVPVRWRHPGFIRSLIRWVLFARSETIEGLPARLVESFRSR